MRSLLAAFLLLLAAAVAWWVWAPDVDGPVTEPAAASASREPAGARDAPVTVAREEVTPEPGGGVLLVRVVDADGAPVAGAEVLHTLPTRRPEMSTGESRQLSQRDPAAWAARFGVALRADARGVARVVVPEAVPDASSGNAMYVCARHAGGFAEDWVRWHQAAGAEVTLRLAPDVELIAKLVDGRGRPVPDVELAARFDRMDGLVGLDRATHRLGVTGADGLVHAPHLQTWWDRVHAPNGVRRVLVGPQVPGLDEAGTEVVLEHLPAEPVLVRMPPTGRVVVEVVAWREPAGSWRPRIELRPADADAKIVAGESAGAEVDAAGRAVFARVALDRTWAARLAPSTRYHTFAGPRTDGEEVVFRIEAPTRPILTGRLLRDAEPLAQTVFSLFADGSDGLVLAHGRTDDDGRFRLERDSPEIGVTIDDIRCTVFEAGVPEGFVGRIAGARELAAGDNELGDVVLASVPPLLDGRIEGELSSGRTRLWVEALDDNGEYRSVQAVAVDVREDGVFVARGEAPAAPLRLVVDSPHHVPTPPIPFTPGQRGLVVVLQRGGSVVAEVVVGDRRAFITLAPRVVPADGRTSDSLLGLPHGWARDMHECDRAVPTVPQFVTDDPETFRYEWEGLPAGRYRVELCAWGTSWPVAEVPDVVLVHGGRVELAPIDLRGRMTHVTLRFPALDRPDLIQERAAQGRWSLGNIFVTEPGGLAARCYSIDSPFAFVAGSGPLDLVVDVPGFRREVLHGVREDTEVSLEPGLPVELTLASAPDLPAGAALTVWLTPGADAALPAGAKVLSPAAGGSAPDYAPPSVRCEPDGATLRAAVTAPGTYELTAAMRLATGRTVALRVEPATVRVEGTGATAAIAVTR